VALSSLELHACTSYCVPLLPVAYHWLAASHFRPKVQQPLVCGPCRVNQVKQHRSGVRESFSPWPDAVVLLDLIKMNFSARHSVRLHVMPDFFLITKKVLVVHAWGLHVRGAGSSSFILACVAASHVKNSLLREDNCDPTPLTILG